jgi:hypothetical protein
MVLVVSLVEEPHSKAWVYLANSSDSFSPPIMLRKKRPSITPSPLSNFDRDAIYTGQERSQRNGNGAGGYLMGRYPESGQLRRPHALPNANNIRYYS